MPSGSGGSRRAASATSSLARMAGKADDGWLKPYLDRLLADLKPVATRKASEMALEAINAAIPATIGGSADLTGSNNTKTKNIEPLTADNYGGRYIYYGIREFGMAAAMNGMALHGGVIPYGGTFLVFTDYCRPAIRLSALQRARVIYVMTHDSIGLGEDGPTHQPIEHLQSLRAMPQTRRLSPGRRGRDRRMLGAGAGERRAVGARADPAEPDAACGPRPPREFVRARRLSAEGGGRRAQGDPRRHRFRGRDRARAPRRSLKRQGIGADVVSMPCTERFDAQPADYREDILPDVSNREILRVSIEAGTTFGWERYVGLARPPDRDRPLRRLGPGQRTLYDHFGLTPDKIAARVTDFMKTRGIE